MRSSVNWTTLCALLGAGALAAWWLPSPWLDWQPGRALGQPWRWWSAAFVHWSAMHLVANLGGVAVLAVLGRTAALPPRMAWAWLAAWPMTHLPLLLQPGLAHYGGLSGVLHAGVAVASVWLIQRGSGMRRAIGAAIAAGLVAKILFEAPWSGPLRHPRGWDIAIAPLAHATGALAGWVCAWLALQFGRGRR